jgi:hypothetical protein
MAGSNDEIQRGYDAAIEMLAWYHWQHHLCAQTDPSTPVGDFFRQRTIITNANFLEQMGIDPSTPFGDVFPRKAIEQALEEAEIKDSKINRGRDRALIQARLDCEQAKKDMEAEASDITWKMLLAWKSKQQVLALLPDVEDHGDTPADKQQERWSDKVVSFRLEGITPYLPYRHFYFDRLPNESHADYQQRTWREHLHVDRHGEVFIPPNEVQRIIHKAAKFWDVRLSPGGISVFKPIMLGVKAKDVTPETFVEPDDTREWLWPILPKWSGDVEIIAHGESWLRSSQRTDNTHLQDIIEDIGQHVGFGWRRPEHKAHNTYGKFVIRDFVIHDISSSP